MNKKMLYICDVAISSLTNELYRLDEDIKLELSKNNLSAVIIQQYNFQQEIITSKIKQVKDIKYFLYKNQIVVKA